MKKCHFCAEEIQDDAVKCRFCGEFLIKAAGSGTKWYYNNAAVITAMLFLGPVAGMV